MKTFKAGAAKIDITPPHGYDMAGWILPRPSKGVIIKLYGRALVLSDGKTRDYNKVSLDSRKKTVCIPFRDFKKFNPQQVLDICRQVDEKQRSQVVDAFMRRIDTFKKDRKKSITTAVQVIKIGDVAIAGIPGELFSEFGLEIKKRSPFKMTMVVDVAGDAIGYIPTKKAYIEGGYQTAVSSRLAPGSGEIMVKNVLELLKTKVKMP